MATKIHPPFITVLQRSSCPFCGSPTAWLRSHTHNGVCLPNHRQYAVVCGKSSCGVRTQWRASPNRAQMDWNRRADDPELARLRAENAQLIAANQALMVRDAEARGDGRPCSADVFAAELLKDRRLDLYALREAMAKWCHGEWDAALWYLDPAVRVRLKGGAK